jgi:hypothetical protein
MGSANTLGVNPEDAAIFESLNGFSYTGTSVGGGDVGYRTATVQGGKYKILTSSVVPKGRMIAAYKSGDLSRSTVVYAPYVPLLLIPYPLGTNPSLTIMTRYSKRVVRHAALAELKIVDTSTC